MTFEEVAERLREHSITCGLTVYESGYQTDIRFVYVGPVCNTLAEAAQYLDAAAKRLYPDTYGKEEK